MDTIDGYEGTRRRGDGRGRKSNNDARGWHRTKGGGATRGWGGGRDAQVETLGVGELVGLLVEGAHLRLALLFVLGGPAKFDCEARGGERSARGGSDEATGQNR